MIQGKNSREFIPQIRKQFNVSRYQAERLLRTEIARAQIQAQAENYKSLDIDEYEYIACGLKDCCPICKALDGKIFKVKDMESGKNAPPMHPNCHCATAPHYDDKLFYEWLDARQIGNTTLGLNEWNNSIIKMATTDSNDWSDTETQSYTKEEQREFVKYAKGKGIKLVGIHNFDGDSKLLKQQIDSLNYATRKYPLRQKKKLTLSLSEFNSDDDFAYTNGMNITLNTKILRNKEVTERNIRNSNYFASPRIQDVVVHEYGHVLASQYGNRGIELAKKTYYTLHKKELSVDEIIKYLEDNISLYSTSYYGDYQEDVVFNKVNLKKYKEITSEILAKNEYNNTLFTEEYVKLLLGR